MVNGVSVSIDRCKPAFFLNTEDLQLPQTKNETPATLEHNATAPTPPTVEHDPTASTPTQPSTRSSRKVHLPTRKVLKDIKIDPKQSAVKLAAETSRIIGRSVSAETVRNVIRHAVYSSLVARKKPFINLQNQKKRLEFAKTHQLKTFGRKLYLVTKVNSTFLEVMAIAPFGESRTPLWIQKIYVLQLNMVMAPSWFGVVWLQMGVEI
ncbi:HTH_Tnp_Tc3_2 domain-containing protein [Trichonephila clavipes]|nr:HTH_Tnp_Tc3_2 domain-containing protein [Trichonephila clavipes]